MAQLVPASMHGHLLLIEALKHGQIHFGKFLLVASYLDWRMQVRCHSHFSALILALVAMFHIAFVATLHETIHLLTGQEVHHFQV